MAEELSTVRETLKQNRDHLLARANVIATGVGYKISAGQKTSDLSIVCSVTQKLASSQLYSHVTGTDRQNSPRTGRCQYRSP